jgi:hypothetical protein
LELYLTEGTSNSAAIVLKKRHPGLYIAKVIVRHALFASVYGVILKLMKINMNERYAGFLQNLKSVELRLFANRMIIWDYQVFKDCRRALIEFRIMEYHNQVKTGGSAPEGFFHKKCEQAEKCIKALMNIFRKSNLWEFVDEPPEPEEQRQSTSYEYEE